MIMPLSRKNPIKNWCLRTMAVGLVGLVGMAGVAAAEVMPTPAEPGVTVPAIQPLDKPLVAVRSGAAVALAVKAAPGAQVGFQTRDGGTIIANDGSTLPTVKGQSLLIVTAGADGLARVRYVATPDVSAIANVTAASAQCSGKVTWALRVEE